MIAMRATTEKTWAYIVLAFVIAVLLVGLREHKNSNNMFVYHENVQENMSGDAVIQNSDILYNPVKSLLETFVETDINITRTQILMDTDTSLMKNYIIIVYIAALILFLCLISRIYINLFSCCRIPIWMVVGYIHSIDGEKGVRGIIA